MATAFPRTDDGGSNYDVSYSYDDGRTWWELAANTYFASFGYANPTTGYFGAYTDANGRGSVYRTTPAAQPASAGPVTFSLTPNPSAHGTVQLQTAAPAGSHLRICDALGREVYARTLPAATGQPLTLDLSRQARGIYVVSLVTGPPPSSSAWCWSKTPRYVRNTRRPHRCGRRVF